MDSSQQPLIQSPALDANLDGSPVGGLSQENFRALTLRGWGDPHNNYAYSTAWFKGYLYCGSCRGNLIFLLHRENCPRYGFAPVPRPKDPFDVDLRGQIWRYDPRTDTWEMVYQAPLVVGRLGDDIPREIGYRGMGVFQGKSDSEPALYVSTISPNRSGRGAITLRSQDGINFEVASQPGLGVANEILSFRFLEPFRGKLYTSPIGRHRRPDPGTQIRSSSLNSSFLPIILESEDPAKGEWRPVSPPGFGNPNNSVVFYATAFNDHLYAGTMNTVTGFQVWKTKAEGPPPYEWKPVLQLGAFRYKMSQGVAWMCPFKGALYVAACVQDGGFDRENRIGPIAAEIVRIYPDDTWDLVVGYPRITPHGLKLPTSGLGAGFNNLCNGYIWQMCVHDGWMYAATFNWGIFLRYTERSHWHPGVRRLLETFGIEDLIQQFGGCGVWKTQDGDRWYPVTTNGFDNPYNVGVRKLMSTPQGLVVGTVNFFGPEVAVCENGQWKYVPNPRGGLEVWLGNKVEADTPTPNPLSGMPDKAILPSPNPHLPSPSTKKPVVYIPGRDKKKDNSRFELTKKQLQYLKRRIDIKAMLPEFVEFSRDYYQLQLEGTEEIPQKGPVLFISPHVGGPLSVEATVVLEDTLLTLHIINDLLGRPGRLLVTTKFYEDIRVFQTSQDVLEKMGCVPVTVGNGQRLLEMGEPVLIYPEGQTSKPAYQLLPFFWGFAKMAWLADCPIVPTVFLGPHESRPRVDLRPAYKNHRAIYLPLPKPLKAQYKFIFMPPVRVRDYVADINDREALSAFCDRMREQMQEVIDRECLDRPLVKVVQRLQDKYGVQLE